MALDTIEFATDDELLRYEEEIVALAADLPIDLDRKRALAVEAITDAAMLDRVDRTKIVDDSTDSSKALRKWATLETLAWFYRDASNARPDTDTFRKFELYRADADAARAVFEQIGWPIDENANEAIDAGELRPVPRESAIFLGQAPRRKVFVP